VLPAGSTRSRRLIGPRREAGIDTVEPLRSGRARLVVNRGITPPWGGQSPYYLVAEMQFPDEATFTAAMASPENRATGKDLRQFAGDLVTLVVIREEKL